MYWRYAGYCIVEEFSFSLLNAIFDFIQISFVVGMQPSVHVYDKYMLMLDNIHLEERFL